MSDGIYYVRASDATEIEVATTGFRLRLVRQPGRMPSAAEVRVPEVIRAPAGTPLAAPLTGVPDPLVGARGRAAAGRSWDPASSRAPSSA